MIDLSKLSDDEKYILKLEILEQLRTRMKSRVREKSSVVKPHRNQKEYNDKNRELIRQKQREYYMRNKEKIDEKNKEYARNHRDQLNQKRRVNNT